MSYEYWLGLFNGLSIASTIALVIISLGRVK